MTVVVETSRTLLWTEFARVRNQKLLTHGYSRKILDQYKVSLLVLLCLELT